MRGYKYILSLRPKDVFLITKIEPHMNTWDRKSKSIGTVHICMCNIVVI